MEQNLSQLINVTLKTLCPNVRYTMSARADTHTKFDTAPKRNTEIKIKQIPPKNKHNKFCPLNFVSWMAQVCTDHRQPNNTSRKKMCTKVITTTDNSFAVQNGEKHITVDSTIVLYSVRATICRCASVKPIWSNRKCTVPFCSCFVGIFAWFQPFCVHKHTKSNSKSQTDPVSHMCNHSVSFTFESLDHPSMTFTSIRELYLFAHVIR